MSSPSDVRPLGFGEGGRGKREDKDRGLGNRGKRVLLKGLVLTVAL